MDADQIPLPIQRGVTLTTAWQFLDASEVPIPLTDYTAQLDVREPRAGTLWLHLSTEVDGGLTIDEPNGIVAVKALPALTAAIPGLGAGVWDLALLAPDGHRYDYIGGPAPVSDPVTRVQ